VDGVAEDLPPMRDDCLRTNDRFVVVEPGVEGFQYGRYFLMTTLLLRLSGVTLLEKTLKEARPGYKDDVESTSEFFSWFPRKKDRNRRIVR
jgi:steroid 5-alpha reductase family enzyme